MFDHLPSPQEIDEMCAKAMSNCPQTHGWQREPRGFDTYREVFEYWGGVSTLWTHGYSRYLPKSVRKFFKPDVIELYEKIEALEDQNKRRGEVLERCRKFAAASIKDVFVPPSEEAMKNMARMCEEALK